MITRCELLKCLKAVGIDLHLSEQEDVNLNEYIDDSIHYISTLVELENSLDIEIDDHYLENDIFGSLNYLLEVVNTNAIRPYIYSTKVNVASFYTFPF